MNRSHSLETETWSRWLPAPNLRDNELHFVPRRWENGACGAATMWVEVGHPTQEAPLRPMFGGRRRTSSRIVGQAGMSEPLATDLAAVPTVPWTGPDGTVHERELDSDFTLCGVRCDGESNSYCAKVACDNCIQAGLTRYALRHVCGENCRVYDEQTTPELDRRVPQTSEGARLDRTLSMSGRIFPRAEPCTDVDLIARVDEGLRRMRPARNRTATPK